MSKSRKNWKRDEHDYEDHQFNKRELIKDKSRRKNKHLESAMRSRNIDQLINIDEEED